MIHNIGNIFRIQTPPSQNSVTIKILSVEGEEGDFGEDAYAGGEGGFAKARIHI